MTDDLVVITSCTASKLELAAGADCVAESFYSGQQHVRLMRGVQEYRAAAEPAGALRLRILSAFYGLLSPQQRITRITTALLESPSRRSAAKPARSMFPKRSTRFCASLSLRLCSCSATRTCGRVTCPMIFVSVVLS